MQKCAAALLRLAVLLPLPLHAAEKGCGQAMIDGTTPPVTAHVIVPRAQPAPFYQWENNNGYCGEVSMMQGGFANGQFMSQFNARAICGTGLSQSGPDGACAAHQAVPNYNAQLLIEDPDTGVTGPHRYANAALCIANSGLAGQTFPYGDEPAGQAGYETYMRWVKAQVIAGNQVTVALLYDGGHDPQYDHEVGVLKIGTNHDPADPAYYPDDVLYFDDHGAYTLEGRHWGLNPAIPPGAGTDTVGCTPYLFGYSFASLANTRRGANADGAHAYSIILPDQRRIETYTGGNGYAPLRITGPRNYGFSVTGPRDDDHETLPVTLAIAGPTFTEGQRNPRDPVAGFAYENPMIGHSARSTGCTNRPPRPWMTHLALRAEVTGLTAGTGYNLYEYDFDGVQGVGRAAALALPHAAFNAHAAMATHVTRFTATGPSFRETIVTTSDKIIAFRCVPATAP